MTLFNELTDRFNTIENLISQYNEAKQTALDAAMDYTFKPTTENKSKVASWQFITGVKAICIKEQVQKLADYFGYNIHGTCGEESIYIDLFNGMKKSFFKAYDNMKIEAVTENKHLSYAAKPAFAK